MDIVTLITILVGFVTIISLTIGCYFHLATKIDNFITISTQETKDFHGRLCSLEARWHGKPLEEEKKEN